VQRVFAAQDRPRGVKNVERKRAILSTLTFVRLSNNISNEIFLVWKKKKSQSLVGKMTNFDVKKKKKHCRASFVLIEFFFILKFVMSSHWRSSTRGISQIWLQVRKESRKF
jgi:hypothetical protein